MEKGPKSGLQCHACQGKCFRNGKMYGKQRWRCSTCQKTQFWQYKRSDIRKQRENWIPQLNAEGVGIRGMARLLHCSPTQVLRLLAQLAVQVKKPIHHQFGQEYEIDELWTFVGSKKKECWLI